MRASSGVRDEISDPIFSIFSGDSTAARGRRWVARWVSVEEEEERPKRDGNSSVVGREKKGWAAVRVGDDEERIMLAVERVVAAIFAL